MRCRFTILSLGLSLVALPMAWAEAPKLLAKPAPTKLTSKIFDIGSLIETTLPLPGAAADATRAKNAQNCMKLILVMIKPDAWELNGGTGKIDFIAASESLCITSTPEVLAEVEELLGALRKLQDRKVTLDVQIVAVPAGFGAKAGWPAANHLQNVPVVVQDAKKVVETMAKDKRVQVKTDATLTCSDGQSTTTQFNKPLAMYALECPTGSPEKPCPAATADGPCASAEYRCTPTISADGKFVEMKLHTSIFSPKSTPGNMLYQHRRESELKLPTGHSAITFLGVETIEEEAGATAPKVTVFGKLFKRDGAKTRQLDVYQFVTANVVMPVATAAPVKAASASAPTPCCKMIADCGVLDFDFDVIQFTK